MDSLKPRACGDAARQVSAVPITTVEVTLEANRHKGVLVLLLQPAYWCGRAVGNPWGQEMRGFDRIKDIAHALGGREESSCP